LQFAGTATGESIMSKLSLFEPSFIEPVESMFRNFWSPRLLDKDIFAGVNVPLDVVEEKNVYKVRADLPGVKKENINVRIDGNIVQIDAETQDSKEFRENGGKVLRSERHYGAISRSFSLADDVDESKATAKYNDGVLSLELPKKAASTSSTHRIAIQ
jgi:HSP20 family protein